MSISMAARVESIVVSVVVPTYQRPALLQRCLQSLITQTLPRQCYELIVVHDGTTDDTYRVVRDFAMIHSAPMVRYFATPRRNGPATARNVGWRASYGSIIAFTDDDCIPRHDWLERGSTALNDPRLSGVWGRIIVPIPPRPTDHELNTQGLERSPCATANCFYRKSALECVGGFDERFTAAWREDSDLQFMLLEQGHRLAACHQAIVLHPARPASWGISLRQQRNDLFNALLYKKHPVLYRTQLQRHPPWHYYAAVAGLFFAACSAWLGWPVGIWLGGALWISVITAFCFRRLRHTSKQPGHVLEMIITSAFIPALAVFWRLKGAWQFRVAFL